MFESDTVRNSFPFLNSDYNGNERGDTKVGWITRTALQETRAFNFEQPLKSKDKASG